FTRALSGSFGATRIGLIRPNRKTGSLNSQAALVGFETGACMRYRELGKTGLKLSVVSYGAASIGNEYGNLDEAQGIRSLHVALDGGVNFIDTSPYYGRTLSE